MKFDDITIILGEFGKYQKILYFVVCIPAIISALQIFSPVFTLAIPDHRCMIHGLHNDTFEVQGHWHTVLINQSIPRVNGVDDTMKFHACNVYNTNENTSYDNFNTPIHVSQTSCESWVYDQSTFKSTFITKANLVCSRKLSRATANMMMMAGMLVGSIIVGVFSDIFGRKSALMLCIFLQFAGALGTTFAPNYATFVAFRFVAGSSIIYLPCFVIGMELVGPSYRVTAGILIGLFWCIGQFMLLLVAYFVRTWNILHLCIAAPTILLFSYWWLLPESPRWLISKSRYKEANKIIQKAAKVNGVTLPENVVNTDILIESHTETQSVLKMFTTPRLLARTLIIYLNWCVCSMVYYGLALNVENLEGDIYVNFAINSSVEVGGYLLCLVAMNKVGRKPFHAGAMILGGVACLCTIFTTLYTDKSLYLITAALANVGKFGVSAAFGSVYVWSAELFPTPVRNSGMGSSSMMARVGSVLCPYIADLGSFVEGDIGKALPLIIFGGLSVLAGLMSLLLPETCGKVLPETIADAVNFGRDVDRLSTKGRPSAKSLTTLCSERRLQGER